MNFQTACDILEIDETEALDVCTDAKEIRRKYTTLALKYHPDKNRNAEDCTIIFQEIQEAYEYLKQRHERGEFGQHNEINNSPPEYETNIPSYMSIIRTFLGTVDDPVALRYMDVLLDKVLSVCERQALNMIHGLEERKFMTIYKLISRYKHVFHLSPEFFEEMEKKKIFWFDQNRLKKRRVYDSSTRYDNNDIVQDEDDRRKVDPNGIKRFKHVYDSEWDIKYEVEISEEDYSRLQSKDTDSKSDQNTFVLQPSFEDLWNQNVYQCTKQGQTFLIPLWHHELVYDVSGKELLVRINPKLPANYWIDEDNNIHKVQEYTMSELWDGVVNEKGIHVFFGTKRFVFYPHKLMMKTHQTWVWEKQGIPAIQEEAIYDISRKKDVVLHLRITGLH